MKYKRKEFIDIKADQLSHLGLLDPTYNGIPDSRGHDIKFSQFAVIFTL